MFIPMAFPPGVYRAGTAYQSKGRYYDANLVRWFEDTLQPMGGWRSRSDEDVTGKARAILVWSTNAGALNIAIGTHSGLYVMDRGGDLADITPVGFTSGTADATLAGGYGSGPYGMGTYGTPRTDTDNVIPASAWTLDTWGEYLVGVIDPDGIIYEWVLDPGDPAEEVANSPSARAVIVTDERFLFALGADGNPRAVAWSDQEDNTVWTASPTNQAGDFNLQTQGRLMCGEKVRGATLLFTDVDVHLATYQGRPFIYTFERVGSDCGVVSQQGSCAVDGRAFWIGANGFWVYNGGAQPLECEVSDYVFSNINRTQISKVHCFHNSLFKEVWWLYPSASSIEVDSYVVYSYGEGHWNIGSIDRLCGADRGVLRYPLMVGSDGLTYEHEVGFNYDDAVVFAETGPLEFGNGDLVAHARQIIPDEKTAGDVTVTFFGAFYPNGPEVVDGPHSLVSPTSVRFTARQVRVRYTGAEMVDWRVGVPRVEAVTGGRR